MNYLLKILTILFFLTSPQAKDEFGPIVELYHGATLFIGQTGSGSTHLEAVSSFNEYRRIYGFESENSPGQMALSAWAFFRNGGQNLYVRSPVNQTLLAYANVLEESSDVKVDLVAITGEIAPELRPAVMELLVGNVEQRLNRFALIDPPKNLSADMLIDYANSFSTDQGALYAPWGKTKLSNSLVPPSAVLAGIITRFDMRSGVHKAPAGRNAQLIGINELNNSFSREEFGELNLAGVNIIRKLSDSLPPMVMGARVLRKLAPGGLSYISVNRLLKLLKNSINTSLTNRLLDLSGDERARNFQFLIGQYLHSYYLSGALQGRNASEAYFNKCYFHNTKVRCEIGVSLLKSAEFSVFALNFD